MPAWALTGALGLVGGLLLWRWLRTGRYRTGGAAVPTGYSDSPRLDLRASWMVVLLGGVGGALAAFAPASLVPAAFVYLLGGAALVWIDLDVHRIPDAVTRVWAPLVVIALVVAALTSGDYIGLLWALVGAAGMGGLFLLMALVASMGLGDVKLAVVTGLVVGPLGFSGVLTAVVVAYALGALAGVVLLVRGAGRKAHLAFGPGIVAGAAVAIVASTTLTS